MFSRDTVYLIACIHNEQQIQKLMGERQLLINRAKEANLENLDTYLEDNVVVEEPIGAHQKAL